MSGRTTPRLLRPFFGSTPALPPETLRTLLLVSLGLFFENYDLGLVNAALPQIADGLGMAAEDTGYYLSLIRLGGVGAFLLIPLADRIGRRRTFLFCLAGMSLGTFASALSQTPLQFAVCQMASRAFLLTAAALAVVILAEELPAEQRGGGIALLSILGGIGFGLGAVLYAVIDRLPYGWRTLYAIGLLPVLLLPLLRRSLRETRRFEAASQAEAARGPRAAGRWLAPLAELARSSPRRAAAVGLAGLLSAMGGIAFHQYTSWFVKTAHGWAPPQYALMVIGGGLIALAGNVIGGRGSDRFGRRRIGVAGWVLFPPLAALFYLGPSHALVLAWGFAMLCGSASDIVLRALATELFPTSHRATAGGWLILVQTIGWSLGLLLVGVLTDSPEDLPPVIAMLSLASLGAAAVFLFVPETNRRELEELTG
jgi:putative MFS transporter